MSSIKCPNCGEEIPGDFGISWGDACPFCMATLVNKEASSFGSTTMGDANAISGGIHNTDSHNVDSHNISDSHNVTHITNYVQESKNPETQKLENVTKFRELCKRIIKPGGRLSQEGKESLEDSRYQLGIDASTANAIIEEVKKSAIRLAVSSLSMLDRMTLNNAKAAVSTNSKNAGLVLKKLGPLAESCNNEEVKFYYNLLLAAKDPLCCIQQYEERKTDSYWQTYWVYMAYSKEGDISGAQRALIALKAWPDMPEFNQLLLGAAGDYSEIAGNDEAIEEMSPYLSNNEVEYSELLRDFKTAISSLYSGSPVEENFYLDCFDLKVSKKESKPKADDNQKGTRPDTAITIVGASAQGTEATTPGKDKDNKKRKVEIKSTQDILSEYRDSYGNLRDLSEEESEEAFGELTRLAAQENPEALYFLAQLYINGKGVPVNACKGFDLLKQSSSKGHQLASLAIGACYLYGIGVKKDISEADKRLRNGMSSKNPSVLKTIGDLFSERGIKAQADIWYQKAAECGNDDAKSALSTKTQKRATKSSLNPVVVVNNIHLSDNEDWNGEKGFWIYCSWLIENLRGSRMTIAANFFWAVGAKILAGQSSFKSPEGQLSTSEETEQLPYDSTSFEDFRLFMPYADLPTKRDGTFHMKLTIEVSHYVDFKRTVIACSDDFFFDVVVSSGKILVKAL